MVLDALRDAGLPASLKGGAACVLHCGDLPTGVAMSPAVYDVDLDLQVSSDMPVAEIFTRFQYAVRKFNIIFEEELRLHLQLPSAVRHVECGSISTTRFGRRPEHVFVEGSSKGLLAAAYRGWFDAQGTGGKFLLMRVIVPALALRGCQLLQLPLMDITLSQAPFAGTTPTKRQARPTELDRGLCAWSLRNLEKDLLRMTGRETGYKPWQGIDEKMARRLTRLVAVSCTRAVNHGRARALMRDLRLLADWLDSARGPLSGSVLALSLPSSSPRACRIVLRYSLELASVDPDCDREDFLDRRYLRDLFLSSILRICDALQETLSFEEKLPVPAFWRGRW